MDAVTRSREATIRIRAAILEASGAPAPYAKSRPLVVREIELVEPGPGEILVRIEAAGLCHSDLSVINGDRPNGMAHGPVSKSSTGINQPTVRP